MSKKQTTTKTAKAATSKPKYYIAMLEGEEVIAQGTWEDIKMAIEDNWLEGDDDDNIQFLSDLTIHELGVGKRLKYIPTISAKVEL
jgi:hypothetical protein